MLLEFLYALASRHEGYSKKGAELRSRVWNGSVRIIIEALFPKEIVTKVMALTCLLVVYSLIFTTSKL